jgi:hypothetical protein
LIDFTILQTPENLWRDRAYNRRGAIFALAQASQVA